MADPTNKTDLLARMRKARAHMLSVFNQIPEERMTEIALYDAWSIKDLLAHIGWWEQKAADRVAIIRRGESFTPRTDYDQINAEVVAEYRAVPLADVRVMEANGFTALEQQVEETSDEDIFNPYKFPTAGGRALIDWIESNSYTHYEEHIPHVQEWMRQKGL